MLTRLRIEDFQSLAEVDLELGPLTVFVGPSSRGKSAIVRALDALASNPPLRKGDESYIRHGKRECLVLIEDEDHTIAWVKGPEPLYTLTTGDETEEFTKLGRGVPEEIVAALAIRDIEIDGGDIRPQIHTQGLDYAWLLRESAPRRARILAAMTKLDAVVTAQVLARRDIRRDDQTLTTTRAQLEATDKELEQYGDLAAEEERLAAATRRADGIRTGLKRLASGNAILARRRRYMEQSDLDAGLPSASALNSMVTTSRMILNVTKLLEKKQERHEALEAAVAAEKKVKRELEVAEAELVALRALIDECDVCGRSKECPRCRKVRA